MAKMRRENLFKGYYRARNLDPEKMADLVSMAIGSGRTSSEFADKCGVNKSTISRILNKKISAPLAEFLIAKIAINSDRGSGLTMAEMAEELLAANGMELMPGETCSINGVLLTIVDAGHYDEFIAAGEKTEVTDLPAQGSEIRRIQAYAKFLIKSNNEEQEIQEAVQNKLLSMGKTVSVDAEALAIRGIEFDCEASFVLKTDALQEEDTFRWAFIRCKDTGNKAALGLNHYFGQMFLNNPKEIHTRITIVIADEKTYQIIRLMYEKAEIPASFSVMFVDEEKREVENEFVFYRSDGIEPVRLFEEGEVDLQELYGVPCDEM